MADFSKHLSQAKRNLNFLGQIESKNAYDWKVTVSFYTALHLMNAHVAQVNMHYITHWELDAIINPYNTISICKLDEDTYRDYKALLNLSRRSRYLLNENDPRADVEHAFFTDERHYKKALKHLNSIMKYMFNKYTNDFPITEITSVNINALDYFKFVSVVA